VLADFASSDNLETVGMEYNAHIWRLTPSLSAADSVPPTGDESLEC